MMISVAKEVVTPEKVLYSERNNNVGVSSVESRLASWESEMLTPAHSSDLVHAAPINDAKRILVKPERENKNEVVDPELGVFRLYDSSGKSIDGKEAGEEYNDGNTQNTKNSDLRKNCLSCCVIL